MKTFLNRAGLAAMLAAGTLASGCIIVDGNDDGDHGSFAGQDRDMRKQLAELPLGSSLDSVRQALGEPYFTDAFKVGDAEYRVLRYRSHHSHSDGDTTRDETTPLLFQDGKLISIGELALARVNTP